MIPTSVVVGHWVVSRGGAEDPEEQRTGALSVDDQFLWFSLDSSLHCGSYSGHDDSLIFFI